MIISIKAINAITGDLVIDMDMDLHQAGHSTSDVHEIADRNHNYFKRLYPDCHVNFVYRYPGSNSDSFIFGMPYNMELDEAAYAEGRITWEQYCNRWYKGDTSGCNEA